MFHGAILKIKVVCLSETRSTCDGYKSYATLVRSFLQANEEKDEAQALRAYNAKLVNNI